MKRVHNSLLMASRLSAGSALSGELSFLRRRTRGASCAGAENSSSSSPSGGMTCMAMLLHPSTFEYSIWHIFGSCVNPICNKKVFLLNRYVFVRTNVQLRRMTSAGAAAPLWLAKFFSWNLLRVFRGDRFKISFQLRTELNINGLFNISFHFEGVRLGYNLKFYLNWLKLTHKGTFETETISWLLCLCRAPPEYIRVATWTWNQRRAHSHWFHLLNESRNLYL